MNESVDFYDALSSDGFALARAVLSIDLVNNLLKQLEADLLLEAAWHMDHGIAHTTQGALLNAFAYEGHYLDLLECEPFLLPFEKVVGEDCIIYVLSSASVPPQSSIYTNRIHVDSHRECNDQQILLGSMVFLSPASEQNGPLFLPGSFKLATMPDEETFFRSAQRISAEPGDVLYFNPKTWHSGSVNPEPRWRHALTTGFCKPWIKQRFDLPALWREENRPWPKSPRVQKRLGLLNSVPVTYKDYYKKVN